MDAVHVEIVYRGVSLMTTFLNKYKKFLKARRSKKDEILVEKELSYIYALLTCMLSAGANVFESIKAIANVKAPYTHEYFSEVVWRVSNGIDFISCMDLLYVNKQLRPLARIFVEMYESGTSNIESIDRMHQDSLNHMSRRANAEIKKLSVKMLFPLVICILPAFIFLSVLPAVLSGLSNISF